MPEAVIEGPVAWTGVVLRLGLEAWAEWCRALCPPVSQRCAARYVFPATDIRCQLAVVCRCFAWRPNQWNDCL